MYVQSIWQRAGSKPQHSHVIDPLRHYQGRKAQIEMFISDLLIPISDLLFGLYNSPLSRKPLSGVKAPRSARRLPKQTA
jgi:site-specific recombinase XerC